MTMGFPMVDVPRQIGQHHAVPGSLLARDANTEDGGVGEVAGLQMAVGTRLRVVSRELFLMEQHPAELDPRFGQGVVHRQGRWREMAHLQRLRRGVVFSGTAAKL